MMNPNNYEKGDIGEKDAILFTVANIFKQRVAIDRRGEHREGELQLEDGTLIEVKADFQSHHNGHTVPVEYAHNGRADHRGWLEHCIANGVDYLLYIHMVKADGVTYTLGATAIPVLQLAALIERHKPFLKRVERPDDSCFYRVPLKLIHRTCSTLTQITLDHARRVGNTEPPEVRDALNAGMVALLDAAFGPDLWRIGKPRVDFMPDSNKEVF